MPSTRIRVLVLAIAVLLIAVCVIAGALQLSPTDSRGTVTYFVAEGTNESGYRSGDRELAAWALRSWEKAAAGALRFEPAAEPLALIRVYWVPAGGGRYGETRTVKVGERNGAEVYIRPDAASLVDSSDRVQPDVLLRDTVVYMTCVHELGHALGLRHTSDFADIMYFFGYGGDIEEYFGRYRNRLASRGQLAELSVLSPGDIERLKTLYRGQ